MKLTQKKKRKEDLLDEAVDGASVRGEIGGVLVGGDEEAEEIVGELGRHVVDVNPKRHAEWVVRI